MNHKTPLTEKTTLDLGVRLRETQARNYNTGATTSTDRLALTAKGTHKVNDKTTASAIRPVRGAPAQQGHRREPQHPVGQSGGLAQTRGRDVVDRRGVQGLDKTNKFDGDTSWQQGLQP